MYYSININQIAIATFNKSQEAVKLDLIDGCIMEYLQKQTTSKFAKKHFILIGNEIYYRLCYDNLITQLPLINIETKDAIGRRIKKLHNNKIINQYIQKNTNGGTLIYFHTTDLFETFFSYDTVSKSDGDTVSKSDGDTVSKSDVDNSINYKDVNDNKKDKKEKSFTKPSKEEIQEYITQENLPINAEQVLSYYDSTNWVKKNGKPVVNWKSTIKNWNRPTIAERKIDIENISFEVKEKSKNHTPYEKLQKIIMNKGISRNDSEIKNILQMEECQQWLEQTESNKTFEATLEDIQTHLEAQNVLKNAYISFLEKFRTSREQIDNDIQNRLPLFLTRCEKLRYTAVIEGLTTITKNDYNNYMKKQSENKLPFISHFDYIVQRIEFIDSEITRLWKKVNELLV